MRDDDKGRSEKIVICVQPKRISSVSRSRFIPPTIIFFISSSCAWIVDENVSSVADSSIHILMAFAATIISYKLSAIIYMM